MTFESKALRDAARDAHCVRCGRREEQWMPISGFVGLYEVSDQGRVWSIRARRALVPILGGRGPYKQVHLHNCGRTVIYVHQAVLRAFVGERPSPTHEACHGPLGNLHNCVDNLRWGTREENIAEIVEHGSQKGQRNSASKLTDDDVRSIRARRAAGEDVRTIAADFSISPDYVYGIARGKRWSHVT